LEKELLDALVLANKILDKAELTVPFGHVSARIPSTDRFLISRAVPPGAVSQKDILVVDFQGKILEGEGRWHGETWIHICLYRVRPDVNSIVHTHSLYVTALATAETTFIPATVFGTPFANAKIYKNAGLISNEERGKKMAAFSSVSLLFQPVMAALFAWVLLSEALVPLQMVGGVIVLAGIYLARRGSKAAE